MTQRLLPVLAVLFGVVVIWYLGAVWLNRIWIYDQAARAGAAPPDLLGLIRETLNLERPVLPAPHQVLIEFWNGVFATAPSSKRSFVYHAMVTLTPTLLGFVIGSLMGIVLAVAMIYDRATGLSVMPWAIASQTIPIVALSPMIIVVMNSLGVQGLLPRAIISAYLTFFPVTVGMVKGLRAADPIQFDLMHTWNATPLQVLLRLRLPNSLPWLFASLKVAVAAALTGAIVSELSGAPAGLGARLLSGSYYGQTIQIWAILLVAASVAALLVAAIAGVERMVLRRMGLR